MPSVEASSIFQSFEENLFLPLTAETKYATHSNGRFSAAKVSKRFSITERTQYCKILISPMIHPPAVVVVSVSVYTPALIAKGYR